MAEILYSMFTVGLQILLMDSIFGVPTGKRERAIHISYGIVWTCAVYLAGNMRMGRGSFLPYIFTTLICEVIFVMFISKGSIIARFATLMASWTTFNMAKAFVTSVGVSGNMIYVGAAVVELLAAFCIHTYKFNGEKALKLKESEKMVSTCFLMFLVTATQMIVLMQGLRSEHFRDASNWKMISLFMMTEIVIYSLISYLSNEYAEKAYTTVVEEKKVHSGEIKDLHRLNHELKNKVFYINELLEAKKYDKLEKYIKENFDVKIGSDEDFTGNRVVDNCIKIKMEKARAKGIDFQIEAGTLPLEIIDEGDFTALLFNLLDNSIEAQEDLIEKWIKLKIRFLKGYIYLDVSNAVRENVLTYNPELLTSKEESDRHGFGMEIIKDVVNKYNGMMRFDSADGRFDVNIMLMM